MVIYTWHNYRCAYTFHEAEQRPGGDLALLLIHPIGVGLSGLFWHRFIENWFQQGQKQPIYNPDLLGCGASDMPRLAYYPLDWAKQLQYFLENVVRKPAVLVVQGALLPVAIKLIQNPPQPNWIRALVLSGPPAWQTITEEGKPQQQKLLWNLFFNSPLGLGNAFYRYARRPQFLKSFSIRQLFAEADAVDREWLEELVKGASNLNSRYAVFSFLAGFWRENYEQAIAEIEQPTLVVFGDKASSISRKGITETPAQRLENYLHHLPNARGCQIPGRNVLPYESTEKFVAVVAEFVNQLRQ